ncbi:MAG: hypothetical protein ACLSHC_13995 [Bilophila wadsworthia]
MQNNVSVASGPTKVRTPWSEFWRKFKRQRMTLFAGSFIGLLVLIAIFWPWLVPYDPENYFDYDMLNAGPSLQHWFGVDSLGRDIFSRILAGARISLTAGFSSVLVGAVVGTLLGLTSGYFEGWWDRVVMRVCDVLFAFPASSSLSVVAVPGSGGTSFSLWRSSAFPHSLMGGHAVTCARYLSRRPAVPALVR